MNYVIYIVTRYRNRHYNKFLKSMNQNNTLFDQKETGWAKHKKVSGPKNWVDE